MTLGSWDIPVEICEKLLGVALALSSEQHDGQPNPFYYFVSTYKNAMAPYDCTTVKCAAKYVMFDEVIGKAVEQLLSTLDKAHIRGEQHGQNQPN